jgi:hypothetical protein
MGGSLSISGAKLSDKAHNLTTEQKISFIQNASILLERARFTQQREGIDGDKKIDQECGYPETISVADYKRMYEREAVPARVVSIFPEESWSVKPNLSETPGVETDTEWEKKVQKLLKTVPIWDYMYRADEASGIGHFGLLHYGIMDGRRLNEPVEGIDPATGEWANLPKKLPELKYLRVYDESMIQISKWEENSESPRFGQPTVYTVRMIDPSTYTSADQIPFAQSPGPKTLDRQIHWTRVLHVADQLKSNELYGFPKQQQVWNRLMDIRKILSGSAEMFWKGAFPGYSAETTPETAQIANLDLESLDEQFQLYQNSLQRYIATVGFNVKSLAPQVAPPDKHLQQHMQALCIALGVPVRIFTGSEAGHLASTQDIGIWNRRIRRRQEDYLTARMIRPFFDRLMGFGVLPRIEDYTVTWPDLNTPGNEEKADVSMKVTNALQMYVTGKVYLVMPPLSYLMVVLGLDKPTAEAALAARAVEDPFLAKLVETGSDVPNTGGLGGNKASNGGTSRGTTSPDSAGEAV